MKKIVRWFFLLVLLLILAAAAAVVWHERPQTPERPGPMLLVADWSFPPEDDPPGSRTHITAGAQDAYQQSASALYGAKTHQQGDLMISRRVVPVAFPEGAVLTFDLYVPPALLMDPLAKVTFSVVARVGGEEGASVFEKNVRQDWVDFVINLLQEKIGLRYRFVDRFRSFTVDLSDYASQKGELVFRIEGLAPPIAKGENENAWRERVAFCSPRLWEKGRRAANDFNVVLLTITGLGADAASLPPFDSLARSGILFENAYAPGDTTRASLTGVLSGMYPSILGLPLGQEAPSVAQKQAFELLTGMLPLSMPLLSRNLSGKGYSTGFFDESGRLLPGTTTGLDLGYGHSEGRSSAPQLADRAIAFIEQNTERPFFLQVHFSSDKAQAGRILDHLKSAGLADNTLIVLSSDRGPADELRQGLYESALRVPLVLSLPGRVAQGQKRSDPVSLLDLVPTILALRGEEDQIVPQAPEGSFSPSVPIFSLPGKNLLADSSEETERVFLVEGAGQSALRIGPHKLILRNRPTRLDATGWNLMGVYDLSQDPTESKNLAGQGTPFEDALLIQLAATQKQLASVRHRQVERLARYVGEQVFEIYADPGQEAYELVLSAGSARRLFTVVVRAQRWLGGFACTDCDDADTLVADPDGEFVAFEMRVDAGKAKIFTFTPYPSSDQVQLEIYADGEPIPSVWIGPWAIAFADRPLVIGAARDLRLMIADAMPQIDSAVDFGAFLWRWGDRSAEPANPWLDEALKRMGSKL